MQQDRKPFIFDEKTQLNATYTSRAAEALEFIAHYLDRIELHLEVIAEKAARDMGR